MTHKWKQRRVKNVGFRPARHEPMQYENRTFDILLEIDLDATIEHLLNKAAYSKSGVSRIQGGIIKLKATRVK